MTAEIPAKRSLREQFLRKFPWKPLLVGLVLALVLAWMYLAPAGVFGKAEAIGYAVCHRIDSRSFHIGDLQFSVCARCTGQYLGAVLGLAYLAILRPRRVGYPPWWIVSFLLLGAASYALDGVNSFLHLLPFTQRFWLYEPSNTLRLITGTLVGLGIAVMLYPAFNQSVWMRYRRGAVLTGWRDFGALLLLAAILDGLVLSGNWLILYPLSLLSAAGILLILTIVYAMLWIMAFRRENRYTHAGALFFPFLAGFATALIQILLLDALRYALTGTWSGFVF